MLITHPLFRMRNWASSVLSLLAILNLLLAPVQPKELQPVVSAAENNGEISTNLARLSGTTAFCPPTISFGETIQCSIAVGGERDTYTFTATANDKILARMIRTTGTFAPEIKVFNVHGVEVCGNYNSPIAGFSGCQLADSGTYTLMAFESFNRTNTGTYSLYLQRLNNPGRALPIGFGQTLSGTIDPGGEFDTYTFTAAANDKILARMIRTTGTFAPEIKVFNAHGVEVCGNYSSPIAGFSGCQLADSGTYTILAFESFNGTNTGTYSLYLQRLNNPGKALPIDFGQMLSGTIDPGGEFDTYTFTAAANDKILARMIRITGTFAPEIKVFDPRGIEVCGNYTSPIAGFSGCQLPYNGTYTLLAFESFNGTNTGTYSLYLQRLNASGGAQSIGFGQTRSGAIDSGGKFDTYTFTATANDKIFARMTRTTGTFDPEIKVFDPRGVEVCGNYSTPIAQISSCQLPYNGTYTLLAFESFNKTNTGNYNLYLECLTTSCGATPPPCGVAPNGLDTCALEPGDILLQKWNSFANVVFMGIGGTYFTHAAIYVGNGRIVEAIGYNAPPEAQVIEQSLEAGGWTNAAIYDWAVIRPNTSPAVKQSAIAYAQAKAADPNVIYDILADKNSEQSVYCSQLVWKAYKQAGIDLEVDRGGTLTDIISLNRLVTPDDLFYSSGLLAHRSNKVQSRVSSVDRSLWRWTLWILSPAHLMITDSQGRRSGFDTATGTVVNEIPGVIYSGPDAAVETISVTDLTSLGVDWQLVVAGFGTGSYHIEAGSVDNESPPGQILAGITEPGKVENFTIPDPNTTGTISVTNQKSIYLPVVRR